MWTLVLFDLPTTSAVLRRMYGRFRKKLLALGFEMLQKSVYLRWEDSDLAAQTLQNHVEAIQPAEGRVTILPLSNRSWMNARVLVDGSSVPPRGRPESFFVFG